MVTQSEIALPAFFSPCGKYRYTLWRHFSDLFSGGKGYAMFIGLNPSTADELNNDPTVTRCINYSKAWGFDGYCMTNLFAWRSTDPAGMLSQKDPVGSRNDEFLVEVASRAAIVVAAWGVDGTHLDRDKQVLNLLGNVYCLGLTKDGIPRHPLYMPKNIEPVLLSDAIRIHEKSKK